MTRVIKSPEERRQELVLTAQKLFFEKGYSDTTVRDIINAVNGSQGMFYHYFKSKDDIYKAAMDDFIAKYINELKKIVLDKEVPFELRIKQALFKFKQTFNDCLSVMYISASAENENYVLQIKLRMIYSIADIMKHLLEELIDEDKIDRAGYYKEHIDDAATFLACGIGGLINKSLFVGNENTNEVDTKLLNTILSFISQFLNMDVELIKE